MPAPGDPSAHHKHLDGVAMHDRVVGPFTRQTRDTALRVTKADKSGLLRGPVTRWSGDVSRRTRQGTN
jgi:hypothetical protein